MSAATIIDSSLPDAVRPTVRVEALDYFYGEGDSHNQVLFDNRIEIEAGQFVVMTGPSGAGKTTLLTLIGALRSAHRAGSMCSGMICRRWARASWSQCAATLASSSRCTIYSTRCRLMKTSRWRCSSAIVP